MIFPIKLKGIPDVGLRMFCGLVGGGIGVFFLSILLDRVRL